MSGDHKYFHFFSKMATLEEEITALKEDKKELNAERTAAVGDERRELLNAITAKEVRLHDLHTQLERESSSSSSNNNKVCH